jgi:hypothetical protein
MTCGLTNPKILLPIPTRPCRLLIRPTLPSVSFHGLAGGPQRIVARRVVRAAVVGGELGESNVGCPRICVQRAFTPKTRSSVCQIPLSSSAISLLHAHKSRARHSGPDELIFASGVGTRFRPDNILMRVIRPLCRELKYARVGWHSFRHVHATLLRELGESLKTSQAILGHSDMQTTLQV